MLLFVINPFNHDQICKQTPNVYEVVLTFNYVWETMKCDHLDECY